MTKKIEDIRDTLSKESEKAFIRALNRAWELDAIGVDRMSDAGYRLFKWAMEQAEEALENINLDIEAVEEMWTSGDYATDAEAFDRICKRMIGQPPKMFGEYLVSFEPDADGASVFDLVISYEDEGSVSIMIGDEADLKAKLFGLTAALSEHRAMILENEDADLTNENADGEIVFLKGYIERTEAALSRL